MAIGLFDQRASGQRTHETGHPSSREIARRSVEKVSRAIDDVFAQAKHAKSVRNQD
ncbi:hypothetical protein [Sphingobium sp. B2]|uniref:hypothetical protein n=1 Tax=Sphingobium sp. B2 TaxID=2583228 RepID=UPI0016438447|nr:hypothetical protein [Sphingobium sp. B2]